VPKNIDLSVADGWQWFSLPLFSDMASDRKFVEVFDKIFKQYGDREGGQIRVRREGYEYQFIFDWQDGICGIDIYRRLIPQG